jgi:hypothetical protein
MPTAGKYVMSDRRECSARWCLIDQISTQLPQFFTGDGCEAYICSRILVPSRRRVHLLSLAEPLSRPALMRIYPPGRSPVPHYSGFGYGKATKLGDNKNISTFLRFGRSFRLYKAIDPRQYANRAVHAPCIGYIREANESSGIFTILGHFGKSGCHHSCSSRADRLLQHPLCSKMQIFFVFVLV